MKLYPLALLFDYYGDSTSANWNCDTETIAEIIASIILIIFFVIYFIYKNKKDD